MKIVKMIGGMKNQISENIQLSLPSFHLHPGEGNDLLLCDPRLLSDGKQDYLQADIKLKK